MGLVELLALAAVGLAGLLVAVVVLVARGRDRRNRVVPGVPTSAPSSWAGSHVPAARLHRRLRAAVEGAAAAAEGRRELDGALRAVEEEALAVDERLVAVAAVAERDRGPLLVEVAKQVDAVERAAVALARGRLDVAATSAAVEDALTQVRLLAEAREEVERVDRGEVGPPPPPQTAPAPSPGEREPGEGDEQPLGGT